MLGGVEPGICVGPVTALYLLRPVMCVVKADITGLTVISPFLVLQHGKQFMQADSINWHSFVSGLPY